MNQNNTQDQGLVDVDYVLYSHFAYNDKQDYECWKKKKSAKIEGVIWLEDHLKELDRLLNDTSQQKHEKALKGLLVLFYAPGFFEYLDSLAADKALVSHRTSHILDSKMRFARHVSEQVGNLIKRHPNLTQRLRFVTIFDFKDIFSRLAWSTAQHLRWWFVGANEENIQYDTPKIIEAIIRLRLIGTGIPVFRLDHDVLFTESNKNECCLGLMEPIAQCVESHKLRWQDPTIATFLFSGSYESDKIKTSKKFDDWVGAFATRVLPALPVRKNEVERASNGTLSWDQYAKGLFEERLARKFYGLKSTGLEVAGLGAGTTAIGAHPIAAVISGALLCISEGGILDLPPFSNFRINVMWIDDHLKYCLHRELKHLKYTVLAANPKLGDAKLDKVVVKKDRKSVGDLPKYVLGTYLPTLLWGSIMDAWLNSEPELKYRESELDAAAKAKVTGLRGAPSTAVLVVALRDALKRGYIDKGEKMSNRLAPSPCQNEESST